jgi:hypothetical protein
MISPRYREAGDSLGVIADLLAATSRISRLAGVRPATERPPLRRDPVRRAKRPRVRRSRRRESGGSETRTMTLLMRDGVTGSLWLEKVATQSPHGEGRDPAGIRMISSGHPAARETRARSHPVSVPHPDEVCRCLLMRDASVRFTMDSARSKSKECRSETNAWLVVCREVCLGGGLGCRGCRTGDRGSGRSSSESWGEWSDRFHRV